MQVSMQDLAASRGRQRQTWHNESAAEEALPLASHTSAKSAAKLFFLFLVNDGLPNERIWLRFFSGRRHRSEYSAWVHCQDEEACRRNVSDQDTFHIIHTVDSKWCNDLVSPMDALLAAAIENATAGDSNDRFVFVSDSTVPIKPFSRVQHQLLVDEGPGSDFCITPRPWWAFRAKDGSLAIKHYQWSVLNRHHAEHIVGKRGKGRNLIQVTTPYRFWNWQWFARTWDDFAVGPLGKMLGYERMHPTGCLDEYYYFNELFGFLTNRPNHTEVRPHGLNGGTLSLAGNATEDFQGVCNTFDFFGYGARFAELVDVLEQDNGTVVRLEAHGQFHPARFAALSEASLLALRRSKFLFARKVDEQTNYTSGSNLTDGFDRVIFSQP
jgi:hypothetical protein